MAGVDSMKRAAQRGIHNGRLFWLDGSQVNPDRILSNTSQNRNGGRTQAGRQRFGPAVWANHNGPAFEFETRQGAAPHWHPLFLNRQRCRLRRDSIGQLRPQGLGPNFNRFRRRQQLPQQRQRLPTAPLEQRAEGLIQGRKGHFVCSERAGEGIAPHGLNDFSAPQHEARLRAPHQLVA